MKLKSKIDDVYFEIWETPVAQTYRLWLSGTLHATHSVYFFLSANNESDIYILKIPKFSPYRVIEEQYAYTCIGKYFDNNLSDQEKEQYIPKKNRTWKIWGTNFINDVDEGHGLSDYAQERNKNIFEYFIRTQDDWIEFISALPPVWELHKDTTFEDMVKYILIKDVENDKK